MSHKFLSLEQVVAAVMESNDEEQHDIVILPPAESVEDSEVDYNYENNLCSEDAADVAGQLELHSSSIQLHVEEENSTTMSAKQSKLQPQWQKMDKTALTRLGGFIVLLQQYPALASLSSYEIFKLICDDTMLDLLVTETCRYARQKKNIHNITSSEMKQFLATILYSGYIKLPEERMYWSTAEDLSRISFV